MKKTALFTLLFCIATTLLGQNIKISEVFYDTPNEENDNDTIHVNHNGEFIELCNLETSDVDISGWTLFNTRYHINMFTFTFPQGTILKAGGNAIVCYRAAGYDNRFKLSDLFPAITPGQETSIFYHNKFVLPNKKGSVYLQSRSFSLVDEIHYLGRASEWSNRFSPSRNICQAKATNGYRSDKLLSLQLTQNYYADTPSPFVADGRAILAGQWGHVLPDPGEDYFSPQPGDESSVTAIPMTHQVSPLGIMEYNIPIAAVPGRNGFEPELSFNYQSIYRHNNMGAGWSIGGLSSIARTGKSVYYDGENGVISRGKDCPLILDGIRLIKLDETGNEIHYQTVSGDIRVTGYVNGGDIERFKAFFPDGTTGEYHTPSTPDGRIEYPIIKKCNINGEIMDFEYLRQGHVLFISKISYGKNNSQNHFASVLFNYTEGNTRFDFKMGTRFSQNKKLSTVTCCFKDSIRAEYELTYSSDQRISMIRNKINGQSLLPLMFKYEYINTENTLEQVNIGSSHNDETAQIIPGCFLKNSTKEGYLVYSKPHGQIFVFTHGDTREIKKIKAPGYVKQIMTGDINGDGTDEVIVITGNSIAGNLRIYDLFTLNGDEVLEAFGANLNFVTGALAYAAGDFNGDGKTEILGRSVKDHIINYRMFAHTGSGYQDVTDNYPINDTFKGQQFYVADLDGDGKHEIIVSGDSYTSVGSYIKGSDGRFYFTERTRTGKSLGEGCSFTDYNGDGCADLQKMAYTKKWYKIYCRKHPNIYLGETDKIADIPIHESCKVCRSEGITNYPVDTIPEYRTVLPGKLYLAGDMYTDNSAGSPTMSSGGNTFVSGTIDTHLFYSVDIDCDNRTEIIHCCYKEGILHIDDDKKQIAVSPNFRITTFSNGLYILDDYRVLKYIRSRDLSRESLITTAIDSYGRIIKTQYNSLSDIPSITGYKELPQPFMTYITRQYLPVKNAVMTWDGHAHSSFEYGYGQGVFHKDGLGFLGFDSFKAIDLLRSDEEVQSSDRTDYINTIARGNYPVETNNKSYFTSNEPQHQNIEQTSVFTICSNKIVKPVSSVKKVTDRVTGIYETEEQLNFNESEAPQLVRIAQTQGSSEKITSETTILYQNLTKGEFSICNLPLKQSNTSIRLVQKDLIVTDRVYDTQGNVKTETVTRNGESEKATTYTYDELSNIISKQVRNFSGANKTFTYGYSDPEKIFMDNIKKMTESGYVYETESYEYDLQKGILLSKTDNLGKKTLYKNHDLTGNPMLVIYPDGTREEISRCWADNNGETLIKEVVKRSNQPEQISYTDIFGNLVRKETEGTSKSKIITTQYRYDSLKRLEHESMPYLANDEIKWTQYIYDRADRVTRIIYPDLTTKTISYNGINVESTAGGITTTQTMDMNGKTKIGKLHDASVMHVYRPDGQNLTTRTPAGLIVHKYDAFGRQIKLTDPAAGETDWEYNAEGQLYKKTRNGKSILYYYDSIGQLTEMETPEFSVSYSFDPKSFQPTSIVSSTGDKKTFTYDEMQRPAETKWEQGGLWYCEKPVYNETGLILSNELSDNRGEIGTLLYDYSDNSTLIGIRFCFPNGKIEYLWEVGKCNALGKAEQYSTGYYDHDQVFDCMGRPLSVKTSMSGKIYRLDSYKYDPNTGQLIEKNTKNPETFEYDGANQLRNATMRGYLKEYRFDKLGNIRSKPEAGSMKYDGTNPYGITEVENSQNLIPGELLSVSYTSFDRPDTLTMGNKRMIFGYGPDYFRSVSRLYIDDVLTEENNYLAGGTYQKHVRTDTGEEKIYLYLDGSPYTATNVLEIDRVDGSSRISRIFRDHQGSVTQVRGVYANDRYSYDPWGRLRDPDFGDVFPTGEEPPLLFGRGYGGHEYLPEFGLINMNARLYDPVTGRFLAPDPYVSDPDNPWAYNRYAYALNNPMHYSDPSGEFIGLLVGIGVGIMVGKAYYDGVKANDGKMNPFKWDWKKTNISISAGYNTSGKFSGSAGMGFNDNYMVNAGWNNGASIGYTLNNETRMATFATRLGQSEGEKRIEELQAFKSNIETAAIGLVIPESGSGALIGLLKKPAIGYIAGGLAISYVGASIAEKVLEEQNERTFVTYILSRPDGMKYVGRSSGYGEINQIVMNRYATHYFRRMQGYGNPQLDRAAFGLQGKDAIRGREQQLIDHYGGIGSPYLGNLIRGVSKFNPLGWHYHKESNIYFGPLAPYTGY